MVMREDIHQCSKSPPLDWQFYHLSTMEQLLCTMYTGGPPPTRTPIQIFKTPQVMHLPTLYYVYIRPTSHQTTIQILKFHKSCICQLCNCALCIHKAHFLPDADANFKNYTSSVWHSNHLFFEFESYCQRTWSPGKQSNFCQNKF